MATSGLAPGPSRRNARKLVAANGVGAGRPLLGPANCQRRVIEVDLVPTQVDKLRGPQAVPVGQQHHGGVAVAVSIGLGRLCQLRHLGVGQILPGPQFSVRPAQWRGNCSIYSGWRYQVEMRLCHGFPRSCPIDCSKNTHFTNSGKRGHRAGIAWHCPTPAGQTAHTPGWKGWHRPPAAGCESARPSALPTSACRSWCGLHRMSGRYLLAPRPASRRHNDYGSQIIQPHS